MDPRIQLVTLGVPDLAAARRFYADGLGWRPVLDVPGEITFLQAGHGLVLGLWSAAALDADSCHTGPPTTGPGPFSLAQVVANEAEVVAALEAAEAAGGTILKPGQHADFGGFHGYFADPAGFRWEVATNPGWSEAPDGTVTMRPIET